MWVKLCDKNVKNYIDEFKRIQQVTSKTIYPQGIGFDPIQAADLRATVDNLIILLEVALIEAETNDRAKRERRGSKNA